MNASELAYLPHLEAIKSAVDQYDAIKCLQNNISKAFKTGGKVISAGNGGSCSDAQHLTCELVGRFEVEREGLPAICLGTNSASLTAIANDYEFSLALQREGIALANDKDIIILFSTSGNSLNLINLANSARKKGIRVFGFLGKDGGRLKNLCDTSIVINSQSTARIQEAHIFLVHILCSLIDQ